MARTSRKQRDSAPNLRCDGDVKSYNTALYLRLSILDSGIKGGESIINQRDFLEQYLADKPELNLKSVFTDNGESGTNYISIR